MKLVGDFPQKMFKLGIKRLEGRLQEPKSDGTLRNYCSLLDDSVNITSDEMSHRCRVWAN